MSRRHVGVGLLVAALVLVASAFYVWQADSDQAEKDQLAEEYRAASIGVPPEDVEPSRTVPLVLAGAGAVLFLAGVVVLVSPSPDS